MKPEAQRLAISEACGWRFEKTDSDWYLPARGEQVSEYHLPDYLNDLNAMHEVELAMSADDKRMFGMELSVIVVDSMTANGWKSGDHTTSDKAEWIWSATAAQRAKAFLRTIGKWDDSK